MWNRRPVVQRISETVSPGTVFNGFPMDTGLAEATNDSFYLPNEWALKAFVQSAYDHRDYPKYGSISKDPLSPVCDFYAVEARACVRRRCVKLGMDRFITFGIQYVKLRRKDKNGLNVYHMLCFAMVRRPRNPRTIIYFEAQTSKWYNRRSILEVVSTRL